MPNTAPQGSIQDLQRQSYIQSTAVPGQFGLVVLNPDGSNLSGGGGSAIGGTITGATQGSVLFVGPSGVLAQDNANLFWDDAKNNLGIGTNAPLADLHIAGNMSAPAWTTNGIVIRTDSATYTDTTSSGTVAVGTTYNLGASTIAASSATTFTNYANLTVAPAAAGTNVTITNAYAATFGGNVTIGSNSSRAFTIATASYGTVLFSVDVANSGRIGIGLGSPQAKIQVQGSTSFPTWTTNGAGIRFDAATYTDTTAATGTTPAVYVHNLASTTIAATNASVVYSAGYGLVVGAPLAGTNVSFTNIYALGVSGKLSVAANTSNAFTIGTSLGSNTAFTVDSTGTGRVGIGSGSPAAKLQLGGGFTATAWTTLGTGLRIDSATYNDSSSTTGTIAEEDIHVIAVPTLATTNTGVIVTTSATLKINGAPVAGTNVTITNPLSLWVALGLSRFDGGAFIQGVNGNYRVLTASGNVLATDDTIILDTTSAAVSATLPTTGILAGKTYFLLRNTAGVNNGTVVGTINGAANVSLGSQYTKTTVVFNGTSYYTVS